MTNSSPMDISFPKEYASRLNTVMQDMDWQPVLDLAGNLLTAWQNKRQLFICGNGGSAGNAIHMANDFLYGVSKEFGEGMKVHALTSNPSILTCLANDTGFDSIFSHQLAVQANKDDLLIVLSGSGNSPSILNALEQATSMGVKTYAILGYDGGKAKAMTDTPIHFPIEDMQISEDTQMIVAHIIMQWLFLNFKAGE